jgi:hypothetical protein
MRILKLFALSGLAVLFGAGAAHAAEVGNICGLINELGDVFRLLRTLCFAGAAFVMVAWAWDFIKSGWDSAKSLDDAKKKGVGMLVGFILLFGVGLILQFLPNLGNCDMGNYF